MTLFSSALVTLLLSTQAAPEPGLSGKSMGVIFTGVGALRFAIAVRDARLLLANEEFQIQNEGQFLPPLFPHFPPKDSFERDACIQGQGKLLVAMDVARG